ncbi:MAG: dephospho-CoA kinase [Sphaerobacteraceae bacterium]|nr:MAG: dephospho-CoA kinase [Sphaerobacteraceae bacterium]
MPEDSPQILGITGNIACGKSLVSSMLSELGADVIDADLVAHEIMKPGSETLARIAERFGQDVLNEDGSLNRPALGEIVFSDPDALADLEAITHPRTVEAILDQARASQASVVVIDAIKLYESGLSDHCRRTWVIICDPDIQKQRLIDRNQITDEDAERRISAQPPQEDKVRRADAIIDNSGDIDDTREQVILAWKSFNEF